MEDMAINIVGLRDLIKSYIAGMENASKYKLMLMLKSSPANMKHVLLTSLRGPYGNTALHRAVTEEVVDLQSIGYMLDGLTSEQKCDLLGKQDNKGFNILHYAVNAPDNAKIVEYLFKDLTLGQISYLLQIGDKEIGRTAVHFAALGNKPDILLSMLRRLTTDLKFTVLRKTDMLQDGTAVHFAAKHCSPQSVRLMLGGLSSMQKFQIMSSVTDRNRSPLAMATERKCGAEETIQYLLEDLTPEQKFEVLKI